MNAKKLFKLIRNDKLEAITALTDSEKGSNTLKQTQPNNNVILALLNQPHPASTQFPIHCAAEFDALNVTKFLCENVKVNLNVTDKDGKHVLHYAANNLSYRVLEYLVNGNGFRETILYSLESYYINYTGFQRV